MPSYINAIGTAVPRHKIEQSSILNFMAKAHRMNSEEKQRLKALYRASGIKYRHSVLPDFGLTQDFRFFPDNEDMEPFPSIGQRMELYRDEALKLSLQAVDDCLQSQKIIQTEEITHLIMVSCTGMYAPGIDIEIVNQLGLRSNVQRTCINFMGCYAAFNGLKVADHIISSFSQAKVLVVCTELCTIHFQKKKDEDTLLANALFADGSAAVLLSSQLEKGKAQLALEQFYCDLAPEGKEDMAWQIGDFGFEMKLSAYVPEIIRKGIKELTERLVSQLSLENTAFEDEEKDKIADYFAIHPGGKRILQVIEERLDLSSEDNRYAYRVLQEFGNMSSPTILFVLKTLLNDLTASDHDKQILSFAFGPGLTLESMLLRIHSL
ncbi:alpha-pyrone synthase [Catalinimonas alkaloidigena]|uniref:type III polyketide synthase n=1 Tax=Catalinimonas alkaloidigena TaxID=1075417 RepID=UPI0024073EC3|nr:type III polyketide synthase [Catalinimonas alkaloidigena]MDF9800442.1 alpha-pyrone synthase [Catalinimonas alkaloidigena]